MAKLTKLQKQEIAEANVRLVHYALRKIANTGYEYDELFSIAMLGYAKALDKYDTDRNVKFSTYATKCITNEIFCFLRDEKKNKNNISFSTTLSIDKNGNNLELEEIVSNKVSGEKSVEDIALANEDTVMIKKALKFLSENEKYIIIYRYGLDKGIVKTQKEIANTINMSQANVSKIEKSCLGKIRMMIDSKQI